MRTPRMSKDEDLSARLLKANAAISRSSQIRVDALSVYLLLASLCLKRLRKSERDLPLSRDDGWSLEPVRRILKTFVGPPCFFLFCFQAISPRKFVKRIGFPDKFIWRGET